MRNMAAARTHPRHRWRARLAVLLAGSALPAAPSPASTFEYFTTPINVSTGSAGSWVDHDLSAYIPVTATGVLVDAIGDASDRDYGIRMNGSTDTWMPIPTQLLDGDSQEFFMIGVDANRTIEIYRSNTAVTTWLMGYTTDGVTYFQNAINKSISVNDTWTDIDISAITGADTAIGAIFVVRDQGDMSADPKFALRKKGSTDDQYYEVHFNIATMAMIGVNASEICEFKTSHYTRITLRLIGYVTNGAVFFTNGVSKAAYSTNNWIDVDITADLGGNNANGAFLEYFPTVAGVFDSSGFRPNGSSHSNDRQIHHALFPLGIDSADIFEQTVYNANRTYLIGYSLETVPPSIASAANQIFFTGDPPTAISQITITDPTGGEATAADDLRVHIPAGFNMTWDSSDTAAVIGGTAAAKVSTTVSYEDSNTTLVLNVTSDFATGESVTVSGLSFTGFTAASAADNLELEAYNDTVVSSTDSRSIQIVVPPTPCGSPFCYLDTPVNITPSTASSWEDVNVSAYVPSGATGVILEVQGDGASNRNFGVRKNGSTDAWMPTLNNLVSTQQQHYMIGVDANLILEVYTAGTAVKTWLVGYTMDGVTFRTNAANKSLSTAGSYQDIDISLDTGADTAIGAIFIVKNTVGTSHNYALRKNGSTDNRYLNVIANTTLGAMIGVDGSEICEMEIANTAVDAYLVGYVTAGAVFFTNAINKSTATVGSYVDVDITSDIGSDDANGAIVEWVTTDNSTRNWALRRNGATYDNYLGSRHLFGITAIDSGDVFEQKISSAVMDLYLVGYTLAGSPLALSSDENQVFEAGDPPTAASAITITETTTPSINTLDDIRVRIPAGFNMTWNSSVTAATISGTAAAKVSATVSYEDLDATLVLVVTSNFAAGDTLIVSGLGFTGFSANSATDNLELDVDDDGTADAIDDKTIQIGPSGNTYYVRKTGNDAADGLTPATAWETISQAAMTLGTGDWVYVGAGVYDEQLLPAGDGTAVDLIRFIADTDGSKTGDAGTVEITDTSGTLSVVEVLGADYVEVKGFLITEGDITVQWNNSAGGRLTNCELIGGTTGRGVRTFGTADLTIRGCSIHDSTNAGIRAADSTVVTVTDTEVHSNTSSGVRDDAGSTATITLDRCNIHSSVSAAGIYARTATYLITNCVIHSNIGTDGIHLVEGPNVTIWNSTIDDNGSAGIWQEAGTLTMRNCIISNNQQAGLDVSGGTADHTYNLFWNNSPNFSGTTEHATETSNVSPQFVSATDRHLQSGSPAVDAGTDASAVTTVDFDGDDRPAGGGWDIGYDERGGASGPRIVSWREVEPN